MKINFSFINDKDRSEYLKEFFMIPAFCLIKSKKCRGFVLRWGFWGILIINKNGK
jgi:hypothetical protein